MSSIPDQIEAVNMDDVLLAVFIRKDGTASVRGQIPESEVAPYLRLLAEQYEQKLGDHS